MTTGITGTIAAVKCHLIFLLLVLDFIEGGGQAWIMASCDIAPLPRLLSSLVVTDICCRVNQYDEPLFNQHVGHTRHRTPPDRSGRGTGGGKPLCEFSD